MATSGNGKLARRRGFPWRWVVLVLAVAVVAAGVFAGLNARQRSNAAAPATVSVTRSNIIAAVSGSGTVAAEQSLNLPFQASGTVAQVLVKEGDTVQEGQALARLDDRNLQLQVTSAQAALDSARARLAQTQHGNARPEDLQAAQAAVDSAQANYDKVTKGATAADIASAQTAVSSARTSYQAALNAQGTNGSQLDAAAAQLQKAQAALQQAQSAYDKVAGQPNIGALPQSLQLQQATIDYQQAKSNYESLQKTAASDAQSKVDSARAQLAQAQANLAQLTPRPEDVTAAKASLDQAKANLGKLTAAGTQSDVEVQQAAVSQAEAALKQAQLALDNATLKAPFAGIVTDVSIVPGSPASPANPALRLVNRNPLHVDLKLSENDVARVQTGQPVTLTVASLGNWSTVGNVDYVSTAGDNTSGVVTYPVRVDFSDTNSRVKVGMTADLTIETAHKENVLVVPNAALLPKGSGHAVQEVVTDAKGKATVKEVDVQTGLTDGTNTEITAGLSDGAQVVALPSTGAAPRRSGPFGG